MPPPSSHCRWEFFIHHLTDFNIIVREIFHLPKHSTTGEHQANSAWLLWKRTRGTFHALPTLVIVHSHNNDIFYSTVGCSTHSLSQPSTKSHRQVFLFRSPWRFITLLLCSIFTFSCVTWRLRNIRYFIPSFKRSQKSPPLYRSAWAVFPVTSGSSPVLLLRPWSLSFHSSPDLSIHHPLKTKENYG